MREHDIEEAWPAAERVVIIVDPIDQAGILLRRGTRISGALHAEAVALFVVPPGASGEFDSVQLRQLEKAARLAEDLGATYRTIDSDKLLDSLTQTCNNENAGMVVVGYRKPKRWRWPRKQSLVDNLFANLDNVDIHLVELDEQND